MRKYSGFVKNHLGDYEGCNKLNNSRYVLLRFFKSPANIQAFCGPASCEIDDYQNAKDLGLELIYNQSSYEILFSKEIQEDKYGMFSNGAVVMIGIIIFIVGLSGVAGIFDYFQAKYDLKDDLTDAFLCFSILNNVKELFEPAAHTKMFKHNAFLNANKVLSIFWIVFAHTFQYHYFYPVLSNIDQAYETTKNLLYPFVYGAFFAVDTFFWGVGYGLTFHCVEELIHNKKIPKLEIIADIFVNRYLLLSCTYFFSVFFFWTLQVYLGSGPIWVDLENSVSQCEDYWYTNILYLNVYIPGMRGNTCLSSGWYISVDLQFLLIVLLFSFIFYKYGEKVTNLLLIVFLIFCMGVTYTVVSSLNISATLFSAESAKDFYSFYYTKPYCRVAPCLFGIFCGIVSRVYVDSCESEHEEFLIHERKPLHKICLGIAEVYQNLTVRIFSFCLGLCGLSFLVFVTFDIYDNPGPDDRYTHWEKIDHHLFLTFEKVIFGASLSLIMLPVALGHFPIIGSIMSSYPFIVLGRLNFCTFLIHNSFIELYYKSQKNDEVFNTWANLIDGCWFLLLCELCAIPTVLFIEMPVMNIYHRLVKQHQRRFHNFS
jgi:peptidoglycan/LPS O-acetylase OafA/YrhL